jgi:hypothetical protein
VPTHQRQRGAHARQVIWLDQVSGRLVRCDQVDAIWLGASCNYRKPYALNSISLCLYIYIYMEKNFLLPGSSYSLLTRLAHVPKLVLAGQTNEQVNPPLESLAKIGTTSIQTHAQSQWWG